ncbi:MAG: N-6 DNA methylase [bacterium]|nr:N-6 DNA methylase [bacterium]
MENLNNELVNLLKTNQELAYTEIQRLITQFKNLPSSQRKGLNEMQTRLGYILPMFKALGWDTSNINEVSPEEKVSRGWVDFSFRVGNVPRFFLETKRVDENLNDPRWVKQAIDYAWTKSVTWALLSDFEGLRVFNAEWKESDPFRAQFFEFGLDDYLKDFERFWWLSKPETIARRLDIEAEKVGRKIKRQPVSQSLFADLKKWRAELYQQLHGYNRLYSPAQIDEAVLRILNRMIFIRTAEDRQVEQQRLLPLLRELTIEKKRTQLPQKLIELFREMDSIYNSELFAPHFSEELECTFPPFEEMITGLNEKNYVRYNFNALEADVLGTVYEQYLGSIVTEQTDDLQASFIAAAHVEEKRTKRKSQGIYYTPAFVTKYIVQQTVGKHLEENGYNPKPPRVLDLACGSGSFLIEAFDFIDDFVAKQRGHAQKGEVDFYDRARQLEVLKSCIFGVDKDKQAVEVARLNLLLRGLHSREKLPMLENIRHGNSLISGTPEELQEFFGENWKSKEALNWEESFETVMNDGGFDIIIGNPPYIRANNMNKDDREFFQTSGQFTTLTGKYDIYILFLEKAIRLLKTGGRLGFIIPYPFLSQNYGEIARRMILQNCLIESIYDLSEYKVFKEAAVATVVLILRKVSQFDRENYIKVLKPNPDPSELLEWEIKQSVFNSSHQNMFRLTASVAASSLSEKMASISKPLSDFAYVGIGIDVHDSKTGSDKSERIHKKAKAKHYKPYVEGKEIGRYIPPFWSRYLEYLPEKMHRPKYPELFETEKILVQVVVGREGIIATLDKDNLYAEQSLSVIVPKYVLAPTGKKDTEATKEQILLSKKHSLNYILGVLCSKLINWYFNLWLSDELHVVPENLRQLPIRLIDFSKSSEKSAHDEIVKLVEKMLNLQKEYSSLRPEEEHDKFRDLEKKISRLDDDIDERVYKLYGLSDEEINIVKGSL